MLKYPYGEQHLVSPLHDSTLTSGYFSEAPGKRHYCDPANRAAWPANGSLGRGLDFAELPWALLASAISVPSMGLQLEPLN
jgi:hypothetical protein